MALFSSDGRVDPDEANQLDPDKLAAAVDKARADYEEVLEAYRNAGDGVKSPDFQKKAQRFASIQRFHRERGEADGTRTLVKVDDNTEGN